MQKPWTVTKLGIKLRLNPLKVDRNTQFVTFHIYSSKESD